MNHLGNISEGDFYPKELSPSQKKALKNEKVQGNVGAISGAGMLAISIANGEKSLQKLAMSIVVGYSIGRFGSSLFYPVNISDVLNQAKNEKK